MIFLMEVAMSESDMNQSDATFRPEEELWKRLVYMLIIAAMVSIAQSILFLIACIQSSRQILWGNSSTIMPSKYWKPAACDQNS